MNEAHAFVSSVYKAIDTMDEKELAPFLTENCTFVFGNAMPVVGRAASADASKAFMALIAGIKHDLADVWSVDDNVISRMTVTYTRKDGKKNELSRSYDLARGRKADRRLSHIRRQHSAIRIITRLVQRWHGVGSRLIVSQNSAIQPALG